jgi:hypothetical protein
MVEPDTTYRCRGCGQLLPFDAFCRVPAACLARCQGSCDWVRVASTDPSVRGRAEARGPVGPDGLPGEVEG